MFSYTRENIYAECINILQDFETVLSKIIFANFICRMMKYSTKTMKYIYTWIRLLNNLFFIQRVIIANSLKIFYLKICLLK